MVKVVEQHLSFVFMDAVQRCGEHQLAAWKKQSEGDLIGQRGALDVTGAKAKPYRRGIGRDQSQADPARDKTVMLSALDDPIVESRNCGVGNLGAGLREGLLRDVVHQLSLLAQMSKELIQFSLDALAHAAEQQRDHCWQRQLAKPRKRAGMVAMDRRQSKFSRLQMRGKTL